MDQSVIDIKMRLFGNLKNPLNSTDMILEKKKLPLRDSCKRNDPLLTYSRYECVYECVF